MTGRGLFRYVSGEWFEGDYVDGKRCGSGIFCTKNFALYEEVWEDSKLKSRQLVQTGKIGLNFRFASIA